VIKGKKEQDLETMSGIGALIYVAAVEVSTMLEPCGTNILMLPSKTTAHAMTTITYSVLKNPSITNRLRAELDEAFPNPREEMTLTKLETLPFLVSFQRTSTLSKT
jgi:hypothetical protein